MSVKAMTLVWENESLSATDKSVLLSLADHAGEEFTCYPSIERLCLRTSLKERTVQTAIKRLVSAGYLTIEMNAGKRGTNLYKLHLTPAPDAPPQEMHPAPDAPLPPQEMRPTPAGDAPEPSRTVNKPSNTYVEQFERFWGVVPRKADKADAFKAWKAAIRKTDNATLISAMRQYATEVKGAECRFIKLPAGWLRNERWDNYKTQPAQAITPEQLNSMLNSPVPAVRDAARKMQEAAE